MTGGCSNQLSYDPNFSILAYLLNSNFGDYACKLYLQLAYQVNFGLRYIQMAKEYFFSNQEIADLLNRVASAYEVKGENRFRVAAYEKAAVSAEHSTTELKDLWDEGKLNEVPGFGEAIAGYLDELFRTGRVKHFEEVMKALPPAMFVFEKIPGIGPKKAFVLAKKLKITGEKEAIEKLKKAAQEGKIKKLEGFGEKSEEDILAGIAALEKGELKVKRMPLWEADAIAQKIVDYLKENSQVLAATPLGSLRRRLGTIGDIDIAVATEHPAEVMAYFFQYPQIARILSKGEEALGRVVLKTGQQVDLRLSKPDEYGSMLQYFTGSKQHNIQLRSFALSQRLSLSEYGIKNQKTGRVETYANEESFYRRLGMDYIPPEIREGAGEIEAALKHRLPSLVEEKDIKGDLHLHSNFPIEPSHDLGANSFEEMIATAQSLGYQYLGFTEHNPSVSQHSEKEILDLLKKKKETIDKINYSLEKKMKNRGNNLPIKIFNGLEVDIKPNGELAVSEKGLEIIDYAVVSVHSSFDLSRKKMTVRVLKGLSHPKAKILGHPTGRIIGNREGFELDWEEIFAFCLRNKKYLEISAWPTRLDLPDFLVREAIQHGVGLVINTDAHTAEQLKLMPWGVAVARRGWAQKNDILNTLPLQKLSGILF